jgi:hypothetical protein
MTKTGVVLASIAMVAYALSSTSATAEGGKWKGAAISSNGKIYYDWGATEADALSNALRKCRSMGSDCNNAPEKSISVESWWWVVVVDCNGQKFVGGSQWNADVAIENAKGKAPARLQNSCFLKQQLAGRTAIYGPEQGDADIRK